MGLNREELSEKIAGLIRSEKEGKTWDFKREWYEDKGRLLKIILSMANNETRDDSYVIIGVEDKTWKCFNKLKENRDEFGFKQQADLTDWLRRVPFSGLNYPDVDLELDVWVGSGCVDVIVIKSTFDIPYTLSKDWSDKKFDKKFKQANSTSCEANKKDVKEPCVVKAREVYTRIKDVNANLYGNGLAGLPDLEKLYRKKFGLDLGIMDRFELLLSRKDDWIYLNKVHSDFTKEHCFIVNKYCPDFYIDVSDRKEKFVPRSIYGDLYKFDMEIITDDMRLFFKDFLIFEDIPYNYIGVFEKSLVQPERCYSFWNGYHHCFGINYSYCYFVKDSILWNLNNVVEAVFDTSCRYGEHWHERQWVQEYVIYFENEEEKNEYNEYLKRNIETIAEDIINLKKSYEKTESEYIYLKKRKYTCPEYEIELVSTYDGARDFKSWNSGNTVEQAMHYNFAPRYFVYHFSDWKKEKARAI